MTPRRLKIKVVAAVAAAVAVLSGVAVAAADSPAQPIACPPGVPIVLVPGESPDAGTWACTPTPQPSTVTETVPGPTGTVTETVTLPAPTTATSTSSPTTSPTPSATSSPTSTPTTPTGTWPTAATTGVPAGWTPASTRSSWRITTPGVYEDVRVTGDITVAVGGVTLRRVEVLGGEIINEACVSTGQAPLMLEDVTIRPAAGQAFVRSTEGAVHHGYFVARRVKVLDYAEGFRAGACGPITVQDSYLVINDNDDCGLHSDGIQGYGGRGVTIRNTVIDARKMGCGTSPFFYPRNQGNTTPVDIDGLWLAGGGYSFRLGVGPATVRHVQILDRSWGYGPVDVYCPAVTVWDVSIVDSTGRIVQTRSCAGSGT